MLFSFRDRTYDLTKKALVVGILNVTPDSFSDGGAFLDPQKACYQGLHLLAEGADILDIGGESTRPGALSVTPEEELRRVIPVVEALRKKTDTPLSIDTSKASVAEAAIAAGATIINDVTSLKDPLMGPLVARSKAGLILMHMHGMPRTMQESPSYPQDDVVIAVATFLSQARKRAEEYGIAATSIILDPGIGFGKTVAHNLALLEQLPRLVQLGSPIMIGHSRKSFLQAISSSNNRLLSKLAYADGRCLPGGAVTDCRRQPEGRTVGQIVSQLQEADAAVASRQFKLPVEVEAFDFSDLSLTSSSSFNFDCCEAACTDATQQFTAEVEFRKKSNADKLHASLAITALTYFSGARLFRVHEPRPHKQALKAAEEKG